MMQHDNNPSNSSPDDASGLAALDVSSDSDEAENQPMVEVPEASHTVCNGTSHPLSSHHVHTASKAEMHASSRSGTPASDGMIADLDVSWETLQPETSDDDGVEPSEASDNRFLALAAGDSADDDEDVAAVALAEDEKYWDWSEREELMCLQCAWELVGH